MLKEKKLSLSYFSQRGSYKFGGTKVSLFKFNGDDGLYFWIRCENIVAFVCFIFVSLGNI